MTRIDFYILPPGVSDPVATACRLCDKAVAQGLHLYVQATPSLTEALDGALWSFRQGSFLSHEAYQGQALSEPLPKVLLGSVEPPESHQQVLINLGEEIPAWFGRFERVLELVYGDDTQRARLRQRFKTYRDRGFPLQSHELPA